MTMAAIKVVSAVGFLGVTYLMTNKCPQGVAGPVTEKTLDFGVWLPKLDHLTVPYVRRLCSSVDSSLFLLNLDCWLSAAVRNYFASIFCVWVCVKIFWHSLLLHFFKSIVIQSLLVAVKIVKPINSDRVTHGKEIAQYDTRTIWI
jgi:hypothetical protein